MLLMDSVPLAIGAATVLRARNSLAGSSSSAPA
jgi:hypothetical protein